MLRIPLPLVVSICVLFGACTAEEDNNSPAPDAAVSSADAALNQPDAMPGATLSFMDPCDIDDDRCDTEAGDFCFAFNSAGPHCTHPCTGAEECASPSRGCNNMGVCKSP